MATTATTNRVLTTEREAVQARTVPSEVGRVLQQVLDIVASGGSVTVSSTPEEVTTSTAAGILGVSRPTLMKLIKDGSIPAHKVGTHHRLKSEDVFALRRARRARERAAFDAVRDLDDSLE